MEEDGFFGFDANLPVSSVIYIYKLFKLTYLLYFATLLQHVRHGPRQELGDVELEEEDTFDAFNDETFGGINAGKC